MPLAVHGIHHVTAISGDAQENVDFYVRVMGMRLVKRSVNQDAPEAYHLFYADAVGTPGTDLTFFPWPSMRASRLGAGLAVEVALAVPEGSLSYWQKRLEDEGVAYGAVEERFGERLLPFRDPHGLRLALIETAHERPFRAWADSTVPTEHQVRGMHTVCLRQRDMGATAALLTDVLGFQPTEKDGGRQRFAVGSGAPGELVEVEEAADGARGTWGTGGIHHVAWRVEDTREQMKIRERLRDQGFQPSAQIDRFWFESVYFREPGGVLFELATDGPGFGRDEEMERLGEKLILPPWMESRRERIESRLPPLDVPRVKSAAS